MGFCLRSLFFLLSLLLVVPGTGVVLAGETNLLDDLLHKTSKEFLSASYTIEIQHRINDTLMPKELIYIKTGGDGAVYMKWIGAINKGRELLFEPGWNKGKVWIKEGGCLNFAATAIAPGDPIWRESYRRPITFFALKNIFEEIEKWKNSAQEEHTEGGLSVTFKKKCGDRLSISQGSERNRVQLLFTDASGKLLESYLIQDLDWKAALEEDAFHPDNPDYGFPGYSASGIFIDSDGLKKHLDKAWAKITDYTVLLHKQERLGNKLQKDNVTSLKFRKPFDLYMKWVEEPHKGRELLYRQGRDKKLLVREGGILGFMNVRLSLDSSLLKRDTNHKITDINLEYTLNNIHDNLVRGLANDDVSLKFLGYEDFHGTKIYVVESWIKKGNEDKYYSARSIIGHDVKTGLPVKVLNYDANGELFEQLLWTNLKLNTGLTDEDFNPDNPAYRF